ncbi:MAG: DUF2088 domain-containing protein [Planctomycetota bacterium]|nr:DUF2088 domain-containing protein [Planctomycetota bacterium]
MKLRRVHQNLISKPLNDIVSEVRTQLDTLDLEVPQGDVAITAGSRGIANIAKITKVAGEWLRDHGANPFIIPAMGSHNGATAEGQQRMVESLGITEEAMGMPIRASMECVKLGSVATGDVWMDRHAYDSAGVLVLNRIKLHTCFSGSIQSGLVKMMVVGMGKIRSAETFHAAPTDKMRDMLLEMGPVLLNSGKVWAGLALLEDGFDQTAEIHALPADQILATEPKLVEKHRSYFPGLPVDDLNVLVVDEIGKTFSGTGMDTNVIGYRGVKGHEDLKKPNIRIIAALNLTAKSEGNALGIGLADFCTQRLRDSINEEKTFINCFTTGDMQRMRIPATLADDEEVVAKIVERYGEQRWMFIPNTLHLGNIYVSEDLVPEVDSNPICEVEDQPLELTFQGGRHQLTF